MDQTRYSGIIADAHTHIFPEKIAQKATDSIGSFYDIPMDHTGLAEKLIVSGSAIGVKKYLVCSTATKAEQVRSINDFIHAQCQIHPEFLGFATLHPDLTNWEDEIERILTLGLRGIKLHPDFQRFDIDDARCIPIYKRLSEAGLPVLFHMGDDRYDFSAPMRLRRVMDRVPELHSIAAHFGGFRRWGEALNCLKEGNIWFDTCSTLFCLNKEEAFKTLYTFGVERFFFGTDFPMWDHKEELERFLSLGLSKEENDRILYRNFADFYNVDLTK